MGRLEVLRHDPHVGQNRHEVGIALPARNHVLVNVIDDSGAGGSTEVPADVEAVGLVGAAEHLERADGQSVNLARLLAAQLLRDRRRGGTGATIR